jgi:hypothetical protein
MMKAQYDHESRTLTVKCDDLTCNTLASLQQNCSGPTNSGRKVLDEIARAIYAGWPEFSEGVACKSVPIRTHALDSAGIPNIQFLPTVKPGDIDPSLRPKPKKSLVDRLDEIGGIVYLYHTDLLRWEQNEVRVQRFDPVSSTWVSSYKTGQDLLKLIEDGYAYAVPAVNLANPAFGKVEPGSFMVMDPATIPVPVPAKPRERRRLLFQGHQPFSDCAYLYEKADFSGFARLASVVESLPNDVSNTTVDNMVKTGYWVEANIEQVLGACRVFAEKRAKAGRKPEEMVNR